MPRSAWKSELPGAGRPRSVTAAGIPDLRRDLDLLLPGGAVGGRGVGSAAELGPGRPVELEAAVVAVAGRDRPVAGGLALGEPVPGRVGGFLLLWLLLLLRLLWLLWLRAAGALLVGAAAPGGRPVGLLVARFPGRGLLVALFPGRGSAGAELPGVRVAAGGGGVPGAVRVPLGVPALCRPGARAPVRRAVPGAPVRLACSGLRVAAGAVVIGPAPRRRVLRRCSVAAPAGPRTRPPPPPGGGRPAPPPARWGPRGAPGGPPAPAAPAPPPPPPGPAPRAAPARTACPTNSAIASTSGTG